MKKKWQEPLACCVMPVLLLIVATFAGSAGDGSIGGWAWVFWPALVVLVAIFALG